ncbi:heat shock protein HtpX [Mycobacteroides abscessus subsp. abscessus]|nr:heat shock protein HtpX [Mycobacteroides abscessus subsp. abscessus]
MTHALQMLKAYSARMKGEEQTAISTLKINNKGKRSLFSTHPDLDERIRRLNS